MERRQSRVHWDELGISEHDKERGSRMVIDEPDTPFVDISATVADEDANTRLNEKHLEREIQRMMEGGGDGFHGTREETIQLQEEEKAAVFKNKRQQHYNVKEEMAELRKRVAAGEFDNEEEE